MNMKKIIIYSVLLNILFPLIFMAIDAFAQDVSNKHIMGKMEMYQQINDKKFELLVREMNRLREDMNNRFMQVDKRFEQEDKRFEQMERRFEFIQQLILVLFPFVIGTPAFIEFLRRRGNKQEETYKNMLNSVIKALKEAAKYDQNLQKALDENIKAVI